MIIADLVTLFWFVGLFICLLSTLTPFAFVAMSLWDWWHSERQRRDAEKRLVTRYKHLI